MELVSEIIVVDEKIESISSDIQREI